MTLPLSLPGIAVGAFLTFVITIGDYITPQILGGNTEVLMPQAIILQISRTANLPMASMMSMLADGLRAAGLLLDPALPEDGPSVMGQAGAVISRSASISW